MKIGIIGLKGRQVHDLQGRKFNGHELEFYPQDKGYAQEQVAAFTRKVDMVILLPQHAPKRIADWVIKSKLKTMAGSISTVINYLNDLPHEKADVKPLEVKKPLITTTRPYTVKDEPVEQEAASLIQPPKELSAILAAGYESQYTWSANEAVVLPDAKGKHSYELLDAAEPGDVVRYSRPEGVDMTTWKTRMYAVRQGRTKKKQLVEFHFYEEYVDILVLYPDKLLKPVQSEGVVLDATVTTKDPANIPFPDAEQTDDRPPWKEDESEAAAAAAPAEVVEEPAAPTAAVLPHPFSEAYTQRWYGLLVAAMTSGKTAQQAALEADRGMVEYVNRFNQP